MKNPLIFKTAKIIMLTYMVIMFAVIFLNILFNREWITSNLVLLGIAITASILLSFIAPRILKKSNTAKGFEKGAKNFSEGINRVITAAGLTIVYFTAIMFVFVVSRIADKKFLEIYGEKSTWHKHKKVENNEEWKEMF